MTKVAFNISMSLDGFITAGNQTHDQPLGENGEFLHQWFFNSGAEGEAYVGRLTSGVGAVICGRNCYDDSAPYGRRWPYGHVEAATFRGDTPTAARHA